MSLAITTDPIPLQIDQDGVARVGATRVTLDTIVAAFEQGATAEQIAEQYSPLALPDIYAVITFYLRHRVEVEAYLERRQREREVVRRENESQFPPEGVRERLLSRRTGGPKQP